MQRGIPDFKRSGAVGKGRMPRPCLRIQIPPLSLPCDLDEPDPMASPCVDVWEAMGWVGHAGRVEKLS
jgi:hypothetical protein